MRPEISRKEMRRCPRDPDAHGEHREQGEQPGRPNIKRPEEFSYKEGQWGGNEKNQPRGTNTGHFQSARQAPEAESVLITMSCDSEF